MALQTRKSVLIETEARRMKEIEMMAMDEALDFCCKNTMGQLKLCEILETRGILREQEKNEITTILYDQNRRMYSSLMGTLSWTSLMDILKESGNDKVADFLDKRLDSLKASRGSDDDSVIKKEKNLVDPILSKILKEYELKMETFMKTSSDLVKIQEQHQELEALDGQRFKKYLDDLEPPPNTLRKEKYCKKLRESMALTSMRLMGDLSGRIQSRGNSDNDNGDGGEWLRKKDSKNSDPSHTLEGDWRIGKSYTDKQGYYMEKYGTDKNVNLRLGGAQKKDTDVVIKSSKMRLVVTSPVFETRIQKEETTQSQQGLKDDRAIEILLTEANPKIFQVFINTLPPAPGEYFRSPQFSLTLQETLMLMALRKEYAVTEPLNALDLALEPFLVEAPSFVRSKEFLNLPPESLKQLLMSDNISMDEYSLCKNVLRWAEHQCEKNGVTKTGTNMREKLGQSVLQLLRFPVLTYEAMIEMGSLTGILEGRELTELTEYFSLKNEEERKNFKFVQLPLNKKPRSMKYYLEKLVKFSGPAPAPASFHGPDTKCSLYLWMMNPVAIHALGFFGPIQADAEFQVNVWVQVVLSGNWIQVMELTRTVKAKKGEIFFVEFDEPLQLGVCQGDGKENFCHISFQLKGPTVAVGQKGFDAWHDYSEAGIKFKALYYTLQTAGIKLTPNKYN